MAKPKNQATQKGGRIKTHPDKDSSMDCHPAFCLHYLDTNFSLNRCTKEQKVDFANTIHTLGQKTWSDIFKCHRHHGGCETISLKKKHKDRLPKIAEKLPVLSFRCFGMYPMLGFRKRKFFYIVWLDPKGEIYKH
jgi:hypothetical protein